MKLEKYTGTKTYIYQNGELATPEAVLQRYPGILTFTHVVGTDEAGETFLSLDTLSKLRTHYKIDSTLSEEDAITAIETILNALPEEVVPADERIAAALEYQNLLSL